MQPLCHKIIPNFFKSVLCKSATDAEILEEQGLDVQKLKAKCSLVCPMESVECHMEHLLSQQDGFCNQISMIEEKITVAGHLIFFLPKFHCELNPFEMVCISYQAECVLIYYIVLGMV